MKHFEENIGVLPHENDSFGINDPLKEAVGEFGNKQDYENFTEEDIMGLVRDKINDIEVDIENPEVAVEEIVGCLKKKGVKISKDVTTCAESAIGEKMNFLRNLKRFNIDKNNPNEEERKELKEMALKDAEWIGDIVEYIRENRDNPEETEKFWKEYDKTFLSFKEHENNRNFTDKYNIKQGPEVIKRGVLTEIAAMDLLEELANSFEGCENVKIEYSTPKQDVYDKIDFFLIVNGMKIPVQVKSCDISGFTGHGSNKKELERKIMFVLNNVINTDETKNIKVDEKYKYQKRAGKRINEFFGIKRKNDEINKGGVIVILPYGDMNPKFLNPQDKSGKTIESCIDEKGVPSEALRNHFLFESRTFKNVEAILKT